MTRAVFFDVDGVLVHGYHARPELQRQWDANLLADLGVDPDRFRTEFIFDVFIKKVVVGEMSLVEALDRRLPALGYRGSPMAFVHYWLSHDSALNHPLLEVVRQLRRRTDLKLYIATNQDHMRALWLWQTMGLGELFEDMFYSARVGVRKPERGFFDFVEHRIGPQEQPPLLFDDTPKVINAARLHGWEPVLLTMSGTAHATPGSPSGWASAAIAASESSGFTDAGLDSAQVLSYLKPTAGGP